MENGFINLLSFGADPTGTKDVATAFSAAFAAGEKNIYVPAGEYKIERQIVLTSNVKIHADEGAHFFTADSFSGFSVITNKEDLFDPSADENIEIIGGVFDGSCDRIFRPSYKDETVVQLFFDFLRVKNLTLKNIVMKNGVCYHIRLCEVDGFTVENVRYTGGHAPLCQDGIHISGGCKNGVVRHVRAEGPLTGDDLIAINNDEAFSYGQSHGQILAPIENIFVEDVVADNCHTGVRLLSVKGLIKNVTLKDFDIGYREMGVNADAARYCADPIFDDKDFPCGVGNMENVRLINFRLHHVGKKGNRPAVLIETNAKGLLLENFVRDEEKEEKCSEDFLLVRNLAASTLALNGEKTALPLKQAFSYPKGFTAFTLDKDE